MRTREATGAAPGRDGESGPPLAVRRRDDPFPTPTLRMRPTTPTSTIPTGRSPADAAADTFLARYVEWREACLEVRGTGGRWGCAAPADRRAAFAAHRAALEREEAAAQAYASASQAIGGAGTPVGVAT